MNEELIKQEVSNFEDDESCHAPTTECDVKPKLELNLAKEITSLHHEIYIKEEPFEGSDASADDCSTNFEQPEEDDVHMRTYACDLCDFRSFYKAVLKKHQETHTGEQPFNCGACGSKFTSEAATMTHLMTHTGEKPFKKKCGSNINCCVHGCHSKKGREKHLSFHRFPAKKANYVTIETKYGLTEKICRRQAWERALLMGKPVSYYMTVCSLHFQRDDYILPDFVIKRPTLKKNAVPSQKLPEKIIPDATSKSSLARKNRNQRKADGSKQRDKSK